MYKRQEEGIAAKALNHLGVEIGAVRSTIESVLGRNQRIIIQQIIPTNPVSYTHLDVYKRQA